MSDELKQKLSNAKKGKSFSAEHRANLSKSHLGKIPTNLNQLLEYRKGRPLTEEHKLKIKLGNIGKKRSLETRKNISLSLVGRVPKNKGVGIKIYNCILCKKEFSNKTKNRKYCGITCYRISNRGENNYRYIKDRKLVKLDTERGGPLHKGWSKKVKHRDLYKCKVCSKPGKVIAHHILSWKSHKQLRYEVSNGISLCKEHHPMTRKGEEEKIIYFQSLIS